MRVRGEVTSLADVGDGVVVTAQCKFVRGPNWQQSHTVQFRVPSWAAAHYFVGKRITLAVIAC